MRNIYMAASSQHVGKTTCTLGLVSALIREGYKVGYCKPVGQKSLEVDNLRVDKDTVLFADLIDFRIDPKLHSPVILGSGATTRYLEHPEEFDLESDIRSAAIELDRIHDVVIFEGTGHPGVGSVAEMSNAHVAKLVKAPVIMVVEGGIGSTIDMLNMNLALFREEDVPILGVIVNKVEDEKYDKVKSYVTRGLARKGIEVLGVMPYRPILSSPTVEQLLEDIDGTLLSGRDGVTNVVGKTVIGAMPAHQALEYMNDDALLITPGTREDVILAALSSCMLGSSRNLCVAGVILTGGTAPQPSIMELLERTSLPIVLVKEDTYTVASKIAKLIIKIRPSDTAKIRAAEEMVDQYVDVDRVLGMLQQA